MTPWEAAPDALAPGPASSLDTRQHLDNSPARFTLEDQQPPSETSERRAIDRLQRRDRAKESLTVAVHAAADARAEGGTPGALAEAALLERMAEQLEACRTVAAYQDLECGAYFCRVHSCHVRLCPDCERSRSSRLVGKLIEVILDFRRAVFWTFTIPNVPPGQLRDGLTVLLDAFRRLRRTPPFRGGRCRAGCVHPAVRSGVYSTEISWSAGRADWHPHVHALMDAPWIRWGELRDYWRAATCDAWRSLEWHRAGGTGRPPPCPHGTDEHGLAAAPCRGASVLWVETIAGEPGSEAWRGAIRETLKYVSKGLLKDDQVDPSVTPADLGELLLALRHRRLVAGWGELRGIRDTTEDLRDPDAYLTLAEVAGLQDLVGLPRVCPVHGDVATWTFPVALPRRRCRPLGGHLVWIPPPEAVA